MSKKIPALTRREYDIMDILWDSESEMRLPEILNQLEKITGDQFKRQTVATFLSHLIDKEVASSRREGRFFYYKALVPRDTYKKKETKHMLDFWYKKSTPDLLLTLYKEEYLDKDKIKELEKLIDQMDEG